MLFVGTLYVLYRGRHEKNSMHYMMLGSAITMWLVATAVRNFPTTNNSAYDVVISGVASWHRFFTRHDGFRCTQR